MKTQNKSAKWDGRNGYIMDFKPARKGAKHPQVGSALYVALGAINQILWTERRAMHVDRAAELGIA